jgi:hypothetical protein
MAAAAFLLSSKLTHGDQEREDAQQLTRALVGYQHVKRMLSNGRN